MTHKHIIRSAGGRAIAALMAAGVLILALGSVRYGGPEGLWRRVRAEIAPRPSGPAFVPTPLPFTPSLAANTAPPTGAAATSTPSSSPPPPATASPTRVATRVLAAPSSPPATLPAAPDTSTPTPTSSPTPTPTPAPAALRLTGLSHYWQTWNNCGPATLAMHLSYFGVNIGQDKIGAALRPFKDDKNVSPEELADYARTQGLEAVARVNGDHEILRQLLGADLPVLIETWYEPKPDDGMGHYRLIVGFNDDAGEWIAYDSYDSRGVVRGQPYEGISLPYAEVDALWAVFHRAYVVLYDAARADAVARIIGADLDDRTMWERARLTAQAATQAAENDPFAWFNLGSSLTALGHYGEAGDAFDRARRIGLPWRMLWYQFAPFLAYHETGRHQESIALADATLRTAGPVIEELFFWKGLAQHAQGDMDGARTSWQRALALNPDLAPARAALEAVP